ncbi:hypothetical protein MASR1M45_19300 [Candidatus Kapaibacterium sp.]
MKKLSLSLMVILLAFLFACSSDNSTNNTNDGTLIIGTVQGSVDGKTWKSQQGMATKIGSELFQISAATVLGSSESIALVFPNMAVGTHGNAVCTFSIMNLSDPLNTISYTNTNVTYTITASSETEISGSFSCTTTNTKNSSQTKKLENIKFRCKFVN